MRREQPRLRWESIVTVESPRLRAEIRSSSTFDYLTPPPRARGPGDSRIRIGPEYLAVAPASVNITDNCSQKCQIRGSTFGEWTPLDGVDVRILRELLQGERSPLPPDFRKPYRAIARNLGLREDTVRNRVRRFEESGLIREWHLMVNPHLLGTEDVTVWFDLPITVSKDELIEKLKLLKGVFMIVPTYPNNVGVITRQSGLSLARQIELIRKLSGSAVEASKIAWPPCSANLSKIDVKIIQVLLGNPRKSLAQISREVGVSGRTVTRRLRRMIREGTLAALARFDQSAADGFMFAALFVSYPGELKREIDEMIVSQYPESIWFVLHMVPLNVGEIHHCIFSFILHNISEADEIPEKVRSIRGVSSANLHIIKSWIHVHESLDEDLLERLSSIGLRSGSSAG